MHRGKSTCFVIRRCYAEIMYFLQQQDGQGPVCVRVLWFIEPPGLVPNQDPHTGMEVFQRLIVDDPNLPCIIPITSILRVEHFLHACNHGVGESNVPTALCSFNYQGKAPSYVHDKDVNPYYIRAGNLTNGSTLPEI
jgi:hypothetical protein